MVQQLYRARGEGASDTGHPARGWFGLRRGGWGGARSLRLGSFGLGRAGAVLGTKNVFCRVCRVSGSGTKETGANPRNVSGCIMCPTTAPRG